MNMKSMLCAAASALSVMLMASDTPEVSNVLMSQSSAVGREVTITYELSNAENGAIVTLDVETNKTGSATNVDSDWVSIGGAAVCNAQGDVWKKVSQGSRTITWRPDLSWEGHKVSLANGGARAVVTAWALDNTPDYMVVDISATAQPDTQRYYPAADFLPGGASNSLYKTTTLLMRKIMAKDVRWTMGSTALESQRVSNEATHQVTLTNNYYIGVYEVTQAQWALIRTSRPEPSYFNNREDRAMRPVEKISYNAVRHHLNDNDDSKYWWPADPLSNSFLGNLRSRTGIDFDLPSEAQWEFAARAGNGDTKWGDGSGILNDDTDANLDLFGRYKMNGGYVDGTTAPAQSCGATNGTAIVGSYAPNAWGLYDMAGNVWEWCLDWFETDISAHGGMINISTSEPGKNLSGDTSSTRVLRGGGWNYVAGKCRPAYRYSQASSGQSSDFGFRVVCTAGLQ